MRKVEDWTGKIGEQLSPRHDHLAPAPENQPPKARVYKRTGVPRAQDSTATVCVLCVVISETTAFRLLSFSKKESWTQC